MKTFILEWFLPDSPYSLVDFQHDFARLEYGDFEWTIESGDGIRSGDNFYMVKTGPGNIGVVMKGFFLDEPRECKDGYTVSFRPLVMVHPDHPKGIITTRNLAAALPRFFSVYGTPARVLNSDAAETMDRIWDEYLKRFDAADYDGILLSRNLKPEAGVDEAIALASEALFDVKDHDGNPAIIHSLRVGLKGKTPKEKICGFLHDVLRSPEWTAGDLRNRGFSEEIVSTLLMITRREGQALPMVFLVDLPELAYNVSFADLDDNKEREALGETSEWDAAGRKA